MDIIDFKNQIQSIPEEIWNNNLPIGRLNKIEINDVSLRKYSIIAKCRVIGDKNQQSVYVKHYLNRKDFKSHELSEIIYRDYKTLLYYNQKFKASKQFGVVEPLFILPENHILATLEVSGTSLSDTIYRNGKFFVSKKQEYLLSTSMSQAGAWLKYYQTLDNSFNDTYSVADFIEYICVRLKILTEDKRRFFPEKFKINILEFIEKHQSEISHNELLIKPSHNDFNLGNIIIEGERIVVLDFGKIKKDSFLLDASRIYHQLYLLTFKPHIGKVVIRKLQKAFLKGFGQERAEDLTLFRFFLIRHTLTHLLGITRFWQVSLKERLYNFWVLNRELNYLKKLLNSNKPVSQI